VEVGHQREAEAGHGRVDHAVVGAVDLGPARGEQRQQHDAVEGLRYQRAADRRADAHRGHLARVRPEFRRRDRAGAERAAEQQRQHRDARARAEHPRQQRPRFRLEPVEVEDQHDQQRNRENGEAQADQRRRGAALGHDDRQRDDREQTAGREDEQELDRRSSEPRGIQRWPTRSRHHI